MFFYKGEYPVPDCLVTKNKVLQTPAEKVEMASVTNDIFSYTPFQRYEEDRNNGK